MNRLFMAARKVCATVSRVAERALDIRYQTVWDPSDIQITYIVRRSFIGRLFKSKYRATKREAREGMRRGVRETVAPGWTARKAKTLLKDHWLDKMVLVFAVASLAACAAEPGPRVVTRTVTKEVKVPVPTQPEPPAYLKTPVASLKDREAIFTGVDDPDAVLGITRAGLTSLWSVLDAYDKRVGAWASFCTPRGSK